MYTWNWTLILNYRFVLWEGILITLALISIVIIVGTLLGIIIAILKKTLNKELLYLPKIYIEVFRSLPVLIILIIIFYVLPIIWGLNLSPFLTAVVALSFHLSAFTAETLRAGFSVIPDDQIESGLVLGMTKRQIMIYILIPQIMRNIIPNMIGLYVQELKNSTITSIIAVNEVMHRANILISETYKPLEIYVAVAIAFLVITIPMTLLAEKIEKIWSN